MIRTIKKQHVPCVLAVFIAVAVFLAYLRTLQNDFVNWDDDVYVVNNIHLRSLNGAFLRWAFFEFYAANWHPLTWVSHALDYAVWGFNPLGHHLTSVVLHAVNTLLVVLLVRKLVEARRERSVSAAGAPSFPNEQSVLIAAGTTGLLFGLHPLHVESVAWVAERKDVLCAFFFLLSIMAYARSAGAPEEGRGGWTARFLRRGHLSSLALFVLALMSKPMAVSLPFVLLLLDWFPFQRIRSWRTFRDACIEKLPFIIFSIGSSALTLLAQRSGGTIMPLTFYPLSTRMLVGFQSLIVYLWKMIIPLDLLPFYAYPRTVSFLSLEYLVPILLVVVITAYCIVMAKKQPVWTSAWGYYVITLLPVLGFVQVGNQSMADRYAYLPSLGPFLVAGLAAAWLWAKADSPTRGKAAVKAGIAAAAVLLLIAVSQATVKQIAVWKSDLDLWNHVIEKEPHGSSLAYNNRGLAFQGNGQIDRALADFTTAITRDPADYAAYLAYVNRGILFKDNGQVYRALEDYNMAIILNPAYANAYYNRGWMFANTGQIERAIEDYSKAIELDPSYSEAYNNRGVAFEELRKLDRALSDYDAAILLNPYDYLAYANRGMVFSKMGRIDAGIDSYTMAIALKPDFIKAYLARGELYLKVGDRERAGSDFQKAGSLQAEPGRQRLSPEMY